MSSTVEIPGGQATLRDPTELRQRHRRMMQATAFRAAGAFAKLNEKGFDPADPDSIAQAFLQISLSAEEVDALLDMEEITILAFLEAWTLEQPLPDRETLGDLPTELYDALKQATATLGAGAISGEVDFSPTPEPDSPTGPSSDSDGRLRDEPESESTGSSPSGGESTGTAPYTVA